MKLFFILLLVLCFNNQIIHSQTKLIAHKSHSGKASNFHKAMTNSTFDLTSSNFGAAPTPLVKYAKLDTLQYVSDTIVIMTTSNYCKNKITNSTNLWNSGRDTLYNHPLFSKKNALDSIKQEIKKNYFFRNPVDSIVFIGYESVTNITNKNKQKENSFPFLINKKTKPPVSPKLIGMSIILMISLIIAFTYYKINSNKKSFGKI
ncbi:hypothetical protein [Aureivirga sp. CE67]|uniref:hypothetical protein n=1 Tax=Aureivirga sp. CE67 TaxID=1788983 RepID=UPI0018C9BA87|nr:hypothetical protein [Aureivirga sp. CE67]